MNRFFRLFLLVAAAVSTAAGMTSCDDDDCGYVYYTSRGTIRGDRDAFRIETDGGAFLQVCRNDASGFEIEDGKRVVVDFEIWDEDASGSVYDVRILGMGDLLTKSPVYPSELSPEQRDSLGNDPVDVYSLWFGGEKYLNIDFGVWRADPALAHFINLVVDEERSTEDEVVVTFTHNAFRDAMIVKSFGLVSFDVSELVPEGKDKVRITVQWRDFTGQLRQRSGMFRLSVPEPRGFEQKRMEAGVSLR